MLDDMGAGHYDYVPRAQRIPIHADKAEEFLAAGDTFNARLHALTCVSICTSEGRLYGKEHQRSAEVLYKMGHWPRPTGE